MTARSRDKFGENDMSRHPCAAPPDSANDMTEERKIADALHTLTLLEKELRCVYRISRALLNETLPVEDALQRTVDLLPEAMQFPADAVARIEYADKAVETRQIQDDMTAIKQDLLLDDGNAVRITVAYDFDDNSEARHVFLIEEREMLRNVAEVLSIYLRRDADKQALDDALVRASDLEQIIDKSPAIAFLWDLAPDWPVAFVSSSIRQFGYEPDDFYSGTVRFADIVHPDDLPRVGAEVGHYMSSGRDEFEQQYRIRTKSGSVRWIRDWTQVLRGPTGRAEQNQGIILDVTDSIDAEERARRYLKVAGNMFVALDVDGRVLDVNDKTYEVVGETEEYLIGRNWIDTYVPDEERDDLWSYFHNLFSDDSPETGEYENAIMLPDGDRRTIHWCHSVEHDSNGHAVSVIAFGTDVTDARETEERARQLARFPLENPSPIIRIDRSGDVLIANAPAQNLINDLSDGGPAGRSVWLKIKTAALSDDPPASHEIEVGERIYQFQIVPVLDQDYVNLYGLDVTAERENETRLRDITDNMPGALFQYILHLDGTDEFQFMSAGSERIWGLTPRQIYRNQSALWDMVHPDDLPDMKSSVMASAETLNRWSHEWRIQTKSGEVKWLRGSGTPRKKPNGDILWNSQVHDVTSERENEARFQDIVAAAPGAIFEYVVHPDDTHSVKYMSDGCEEIWGLTAQQICDDPGTMWGMIHTDDLAAMEKSVSDSSRNLTEWKHEWRITLESGEEKWLRGSGMPHKRPNGDVSAIALVVDITEEKSASAAVSNALRKTVTVLSAALEARDPYTAGHEERVAEIAVAIGRQMGLDPHRMTGLELAATVHDVGKIQVPAEILSKPTRLSNAEFELIKMHPTTGAELLKEVEFEWPIADIILQHHERFDGSGYPSGIAGENILLEARILAVADTFEAMASHRPYRAGLGIEAAAAEIREGAGSRYDPDVANACLTLIERGAPELTSLSGTS